MTKTSVQELSQSEYKLYDGIPCSFTVERILRVEPVNGGTGGLRLVKEAVEAPYIKDFALGGNDGPTSWSEEFDTSDWGIFVARSDDEVVGGTTIVTNTDLYPLNRFQRGDLAVMWDMRVHPNWRQAGVAGELFRYAAAWTSKRGFSQLGMETQNTNVPIFRF